MALMWRCCCLNCEIINNISSSGPTQDEEFSMELQLLENDAEQEKAPPEELVNKQGPELGYGRAWRDEDLCFKHRRIIYCRRRSMSMTNLFDPLQVDMEGRNGIEDVPAAQKRCTFPPSRTKHGVKYLVGHHILQNYRKLECDSDSSSPDSQSSDSSSTDTSSSVTSTDQEPETVDKFREPQIISCGINENAKDSINVQESELPDGRQCPLCLCDAA